MRTREQRTRLGVWVVAGCLLVVGGRARADQVALDVSLANPVLPAESKQTTHLKIGLTGFEMKSEGARAPANVAIVLDKSGSMQGEKIAKAREAAAMVVGKLNDNDIVSVIAYDQSVSVLVPATKASDRNAIVQGINRLTAGGSTALFAGVSKGAAEVRKFMSRQRMNRVILLSDGLANVGPDSPGELGELGTSLVKEGISVTTIGLGLGYNEDLMTQLAQRSDGNSYFAETTKDMVRLFNAEFEDVTSVVAQEIVIRVDCADGVRPVRALGRDADIVGNRVTASINQLCSGQEKYLLLEVEVSPGADGRSREVARVSVSYANMQTQTTDELASTVAARFSSSPEKVADSVDRDAMIAAVKHLATEKNKLAVTLRDAGRIQEAQDVLTRNAEFLKQQGAQLQSDELVDYGGANSKDAQNLDDEDWVRQRKKMRGWQIFNEQQQLAR